MMQITAEKIMSMRIQDKEMSCPIHGMVIGKYAVMPDGTEHKPECPYCSEDRERKEREEEMSNVDKARLRERMRKMNVDEEYWYKTLDDYKPKTKQQGLYLKAVRTMIDKKRGKLLVLGRNGTGKTMLSCEALKKLGGIRQTVFEMSLAMREPNLSRTEYASQLIEAPLLVIDEVGRSKGSEFEQNFLSYILDKRHSNNRPFIVLGNTHFLSRCPDKGCERCLEKYLDNDILSRFQQGGLKIQLEDTAPDWRTGKYDEQ